MIRAVKVNHSINPINQYSTQLLGCVASVGHDNSINSELV
jgi:hypothetical protein